MLENAGKGSGLLKTWSGTQVLSYEGIKGKGTGATSGLPGQFLSLPLLPSYHPTTTVWGMSVVNKYSHVYIISPLSEHTISCCSSCNRGQSSESLFQRHTRSISNGNYRSFSIWTMFISPGYPELRWTVALGVRGTPDYLSKKLIDMMY